MTLIGEQQPPPPPQGPGVLPPFPAPPVEGARPASRHGLGIGVTVLRAGLRRRRRRGGRARHRRWAAPSASRPRWSSATTSTPCRTASGRRPTTCSASRRRHDETESEFTSRVSAEEPIATYDVGDVELVQLSTPVDVTYTDGDTAELRAYLGQNRETGGFEVCSIEE